MEVEGVEPIDKACGRQNRSCSSESQKHVKQRPPMLSLPSSPSLNIPTQPVKPANRIQEESHSGSAYGVASRRGKRRVNREDRCTALPFVDTTNGSIPLSIFGVFDGHGGQRAAQFASKRLPQVLLRRMALRDNNVQEALRLSFLKTDQEFNCGGPQTRLSFQQRPEIVSRSKSGSRFASLALQNTGSFGGPHDIKRISSQKYDLPSDGSSVSSSTSIQTAPSMSSDQSSSHASQQPSLARHSSSKAEEQLSSATAVPNANCGTTATVVVICGEELTVAHVGDSRAVLCSSGAAIPISEDHRPGRADEMSRIESAGGLILKVGGTYRVNGVLAVSRAIGDKALKEFVVAEPDISTRKLEESDEFLVVASDGLWDTMDDQECISETKKFLQNGVGQLEEAAKGLVAVACDRGNNDDISVLVIDLKEYISKLEDRERDRKNGPEVIQEAVVDICFSNLDIMKPVEDAPGRSGTIEEKLEERATCLQTPRAGTSFPKSTW